MSQSGSSTGQESSSGNISLEQQSMRGGFYFFEAT